MPFDQDRYEQDVIKPLRREHGLPDDNLVRRYAIEPDMTALTLPQHLRIIRMYWNQKATGPDSRARVCKMLLAADEELQRTDGARMSDPAWWQAKASARDQQIREAIARLAADLGTAYKATGQISRAHLAVMARELPDLSPEQIDEAVRIAKLRIVDTVDLPKTSGLDRTAYRALTDRLAELHVPTIVHLVHPQLNQPFTLVQTFSVPGGPRVALDRGAVDAQLKAAEATADSVVLRARKAALGLLRTGVDAGADLRTIALFQIVEKLGAGRSQNLAEVLLVRRAIEMGLEQRDAELLVASMPVGGDATSPESPATRIRDLIEDGQLRAAQQALAALPSGDPEHAQVKTLVDAAHATVERHVREAATAVTEQREEDAERLLREAVRIAGDDDELAARLARVPPAPARDTSAVEVSGTVRLAWKAPNSSAGTLTYRIVRTDDRVATGPNDGTAVTETSETTAVDRQPPVARQIRYAIFASANGVVWSRAAVASVLVTPQVSDVAIRADQNRVAVTWKRHAETKAVRVRRTVGRPPTNETDGTPVEADLDSFTDRAIDEGKEYFYSLVAIYHNGRHQEIAAPMVVESAAPRAAGTPVDGLSVSPLSVSGDSSRVKVTWSTLPGAHVRIRYADRPPTWEFGETITMLDLDRYGREVIGPRQVDGDETLLEADVAAGQHVYVAFALGGTGAVVGRPVTMGVIEPIRQLTARRIGAEALLSWVWPTDVGLAEIVWTTPERVETRRITKAQYVDGGGCRLSVGLHGGTARVTAIAVGSIGEAMSPPAKVMISGRSASLSYRIARPDGLKGRLSRARILHVQIDTDCSGVELIVVAAAGFVMPLRSDQGTVVNRFRGIAFKSGTTLTFDIEIPPELRRPYWLRCFVTSPENITVIDPPIDNLKVS